MATKNILKQVFYLTIVPISCKNNSISFFLNLLIFKYFKGYNIERMQSEYLCKLIEKKKLTQLKLILNSPLSSLFERIIFRYVLFFGYYSQFLEIKDNFNNSSLDYHQTIFLSSYFHQQMNNDSLISLTQYQLSNFLSKQYSFAKNLSNKPTKNQKQRILYVTGFFNDQNLFNLFDAVSANHDHTQFDFSICLTAPSKKHEWLTKYHSLGFKILSMPDLKKSTFDIVVDWDGLMSKTHSLYAINNKIAPIYISFCNDFLPGGFHDHCITFNSLQMVKGVPSEFYLPLADENLMAFLNKERMHISSTDNSIDLNNYIGLPHHILKISDKDCENIACFLKDYPDKKIALIHSLYQYPKMRHHIEEKFDHYGIKKTQLTYFTDTYPDYITRLKSMNFYFATSLPGGRTTIETMANGILSPYLENDNHIYSRFSCLYPKVMGLDWLVTNNTVDYQLICKKLVTLSKQDRIDITNDINYRIDEYQKHSADSYSKSLEAIFKSFA